MRRRGNRAVDFEVPDDPLNGRSGVHPNNSYVVRERPLPELNKFPPVHDRLSELGVDGEHYLSASCW